MAASIVLSQNANSGLDGVNLVWQISGMATLKEVSLIYYANTADSIIRSLDVSPANAELNLNLDSGVSYSFQLQITDANALTAYSNVLQLTAPYSLSAPVIQSFVGLDGSVDLVVQNPGNSLTSADSVEFVLKKSDNSLFWIIKPYASNGQYNLSADDNALLTNNQSYRVACMFQPAVNNALYDSPSDMSNSMTVTPTNLPNAPGSISVASVGVSSAQIKATWTRPSDFSEWSNNFSIALRLYNFVEDSYALVTLSTDVLEYTFTGLSRDTPYKVYLKYINQFGNGVEISSNSITPTTRPDAPVMADVQEGDTQIILNWSAPVNNGGSAVTAYKLYAQSIGNNPGIVATLGANVLTYTHTGLTNGTTIGYFVVAVNAIGDSASSNSKGGTPYGDCSVENVVISGKTLSMTFRPNGRAIAKIFVLALDSNPSKDDVPANFFYEVPTGSISGAVTGTFILTKSFSTFSDNISFYCVIANNANSTSYLKFA